MIEAQGLSKTYGNIHALKEVSFEAHPGEIVGVLGPNGAGKTTTLRILSTLLPATSGSARVAGFDVARDSIEVRRRIGYLPESNPLPEEMRVIEYLDYRGQLKGLFPRAARRTKIEEILHRCQVAEVRQRILGHLSKGYRQRVGLADALLADPPVVVLDEPTSGLDPHQVRHLRAIVRELRENKTVLLCTHILSEASVLCDRLIVIDRGKIVGSGTMEELAETHSVSSGPDALEEIFVRITRGGEEA